MSEHEQHITGHEAHGYLAQAQGHRPGTSRDAEVYAAGTALVGLVFGVGQALAVSGWLPERWRWTLPVGTVLLTIAVLLWRRRAGHTVPRGAGTAVTIALGVTVAASVLMFTLVNRASGGQTVGQPWGVVLVVLVVSAAPLVIAGWLVHHRAGRER